MAGSVHLEGVPCLPRLFFDGSTARIRTLPVLTEKYWEASQWKTTCDPSSFVSVIFFSRPPPDSRGLLFGRRPSPILVFAASGRTATPSDSCSFRDGARKPEQ